MAAPFLKVNKSHPAIALLISGCQQMRQAKANVAAGFAALNAMKDQAGSDPAHFDQLVAECGVAAGDYADELTAAQTLFNEAASTDGNMAAGDAAAKQLAGLLGV